MAGRILAGQATAISYSEGWFVEMLLEVNEVVDREVVLAFVEARAASDDLLELAHRLDWPQQDDVANVPGVDAGRQLLAGSQDRWDGLFVVLKRL